MGRLPLLRDDSTTEHIIREAGQSPFVTSINRKLSVNFLDLELSEVAHQSGCQPDGHPPEHGPE
ncbi:hypothetical protein Hesp01_32180 [Herbidospora sp. NBRC 101105]|nr:hypothetical protein Hesp01_32180 [Herbidospora sp. NBRC 101105]